MSSKCLAEVIGRKHWENIKLSLCQLYYIIISEAFLCLSGVIHLIGRCLIGRVYMDSSSHEMTGHHCKLFQCLQKQEGSPECIAHYI